MGGRGERKQRRRGEGRERRRGRRRRDSGRREGEVSEGARELAY